MTSPGDAASGRLRTGAAGLLAALALFAVPDSARAQSDALRLTAGSSDTMTVQPGGRFTVAFRLENIGPDTLDLHGTPDLPDGWRLVAPPGRVALAPGDHEVTLIGVAPPDGAWPRCLPLRYRVRHASEPEGSPTVLATASRPLCVASRPGLEARMLDVPEQVIAGDEYRVRLRVSNTGNVPVGAGIDLRAHGLEARAGRETVQVAPGQATTVPLVVRTPARPGLDGEHVLQVRLDPEDDDVPATVATSRVPIVPRGGGASSSSEGGLRTRVTARAGRGAGDVAPLEIRGGGPVPVGQGGTLTFLARGPAARWGARDLGDRYWARFRSRRTSARVGDGHYRLSRLTEPGRYAFGGSLEQEAGAWTFGGLVNGSRGQRDLPTEMGGFAGVGVGDRASLRVNYLRRGGDDAAGAGPGPSVDAGAHLASTQAEVDLGSAARVSGEAGLGRAAGREARAYTARIAGSLPVLSYQLSRTRGEAGYPNEYGGVTQNLARLGIDLGPLVQLDGFYSDHRVDRGETAGESGRRAQRRYRRVGAGLSLGHRVSVRASETHRGRRSGAGLLRSRSVEARTGWSHGSFQLEAGGEAGRVLDLEAAGDRDFRSLDLRAGVTSPSGGHLTVGAEGFSGYRLFRERAERSVRMLLDTSLPIGPNLDLGLFGESRWLLNRDLPPGGHVRARLSYELPFGHQLGLRGRAPVGPGFGADELEAVAEYTVPFHVSLGDREESTELRGAVVDVATGEGVEGVVMRLGGQRTVTGDDGEFTIDGVSPGRHYLRPDLSTLDDRLSPTGTMPRVVRLEKGTTARTRVEVAETGTISGRVDIRERTSMTGRTADADTSARGLGEVLVVLSGPSGTYQETTDGSGRFSFSRMPPGAWTVSIEPGELPPHHAFDRTSVDMDLEPGGEAEAQFLAVPEIQRIRLIDEGEVETSGGGGA